MHIRRSFAERFRISDPKIKALRDEGDKARDERRWEAAISAYKQYLDIYSEDFCIWVQLGHAYKESGNFAGAESAYRSALSLKNEDSDLLLNLGHLSKLQGNLCAASDFYRRSFDIDQNKDAAHEMYWLAGLTGPHGKSAALLSPSANSVADAVISTEYFDAEYYCQQLSQNRVKFDRSSLTETYKSRAILYESPIRLLDPAYYLRNNNELLEKGDHPVKHFVLEGDKEGRNPSPAFDSKFYLARYPDARRTGALRHYIMNNGRNTRPNRWFDPTFYASQIQARNGNPYYDFLDRVGQEGPAPNELFQRFIEDNGAHTAQQETKPAGVDIIVPFFKDAVAVELARLQFLWLRKELEQTGARVIIINDSPEQTLVDKILKQIVRALKPVPCIYLVNKCNIGFVKSSNLGLEIARRDNRHALLLNSDAYLAPGTLTELLASLEFDPMVAFANPRTNNATIATWPSHETVSESWTYEDCYSGHGQAARLLRRFNFVPVVVGYCMLIRQDILAEFGLFDEAYGRGYYEENDLIMRVSQAGYRSVLANRAYCFHLGGASFGSILTAHVAGNKKLFIERYPEFLKTVPHYFKSAEYKADQLTVGVLKSSDSKMTRIAVTDVRHRLRFDLSQLGEFYGGTFQAASSLFTAGGNLWSKDFVVQLVASKAAATFHGMDKLPGVELVEPESNLDGLASIVLRFGQPFDFDSIRRVTSAAPINVYFMLDTIAQDCANLFRPEIEQIWSFVAQTSDGIIFQSDFTRDLFLRRYPIGAGVRTLVSRHSLSLADYATPDEPHGSNTRGPLFILGNHYVHKFAGPTFKAVSRAFPERPVIALWDQDLDLGNRVILKPGKISAERLKAVEHDAACFILPSHYEGFGFSLFRGLALGKPVFIRDTPLTNELIRESQFGAGVHTYRTTDELIEKLRDTETWLARVVVPNKHPHNWSASATEVLEFLLQLVQNSAGDLLRRRQAWSFDIIASP